ncbi:hypothetical protein LCGC14_0196230 [marine sediment metagenome]|uniref:Uncharacterized protein n=1 Tax=marine sediment metagenome TaxID=412755 RepID=A0A0F9UKN5_9ZZZZ
MPKWKKIDELMLQISNRVRTYSVFFELGLLIYGAINGFTLTIIAFLIMFAHSTTHANTERLINQALGS